jgi:hypothetical protein
MFPRFITGMNSQHGGKKITETVFAFFGARSEIRGEGG